MADRLIELRGLKAATSLWIEKLAKQKRKLQTAKTSRTVLQFAVCRICLRFGSCILCEWIK